MVLKLVCLAFFLFLFASLYNHLCKRFSIYDSSNYRSSHIGKVNTGGGILFFISISIYFFLYNNTSLYFYLSFFLICLLGYLDDLKFIKHSKEKLIYQLFVSIIFLLEFQFSYSLLFIPILFLIVLNSYNFMDGINGMIGLFTLFLIPVLILFNNKIFYLDEMFFNFLIIGLLVFGYYNFRKKALLFAGDIGSLSLGFLVFFLIIKLYIATNSILCFSLILIFFADTIFTIIYRLVKREDIFKPHRLHIYERLVDNTKLTHLNVAFIYCLLQLFLNLIIFSNYDSLVGSEFTFYVIVLTILLTIYSLMLYYLEKLKFNKNNKTNL